MPAYRYHARAAEVPLAQDYYRGRPVLVLGADGFLGRNMVEALLQLDARVTVLTRRQRPRVEHPALRWVSGDLTSADIVAKSLAGQEVVFDFAGGSSAAESNRQPLTSLEQECLPQANLVQCCIRSGVRPMIMFCSSRLVYGHPGYLPVDESHPLQPQSVYAVHKITVEYYLRLASEQHGLGHCILRLSNPYGPYQPPDNRGYGVINQFIYQATKGEVIHIYGDGAQRRDYVYVDDVISAFLLAAATPECRNQTFNLGGDRAISVAEAATTISRLAGAPPVAFVPWPEESARVETGDYQTATGYLDGLLDLPPRIDFEEGVKRTLDYYLQCCSERVR